jgi:hypothetical protein
MGQAVNFSIMHAGNKLRFTSDKITITVDECLYSGGKHLIANPATANASFECCGTIYTVENTCGARTVEDWYLEELMPKRQMMDLLMG